MEITILIPIIAIACIVSFAVGHKIGEAVGYYEAVNRIMSEWATNKSGAIIDLDKALKRKVK